MNKLIKLAAMIICLSVTSCSYVENYFDVAKDKGVSKVYIEDLNTWTRKDAVYSQFETNVMISTTYKSNAFNRAYLNEYARIYNLTDVEMKRREEMLFGFPSTSTEFLFYASMVNKDANDFDKANSIWKIFLIDEKGNKVEPLEIRKIEKISAIMEGFFPYINKYYGTSYNLKFPPIVSEAEAMPRMRLVFTSVMGRVEQTWP
jgi:hypothetical protein